MRVTFIGHCTFELVLNDGTVVITDPWFGELPAIAAWLAGKRTVAPAVTAEAIERCDMLLISHNHVDHMDDEALELAKRTNAIVIGSVSAARRAMRSGLARVVALAPKEHLFVNGIHIYTTPAEHPLAKTAVGFVIQADGESVYFSGDTRYTDALAQYLRGFTLDAAIVQIACSYWFGKPDGMTAVTASDLVRQVHPRIVIPMHYHIDRKISDPSKKGKMPDPADLERILRHENVRVEIMTLGESISLV